MSSPNLKLSVTGDHFSITPMPAHVESRCTFGEDCHRRASHRLLLLQPAAEVLLLCDTHTIAWAGDQRFHITTAQVRDPAA